LITFAYARRYTATSDVGVVGHALKNLHNSPKYKPYNLIT